MSLATRIQALATRIAQEIKSLRNTQPYQSGRDFPNGTLIKTDIDYSSTNGEPFIIKIEGNSYGSVIPFDIQFQGYIYADSVINYGGISNGSKITGMSLFNYSGKLCFWWPYQAYWQGFTVTVGDSYEGRRKNRLISVTNESKPISITKEVAISSSIRQSWHNGNDGIGSGLDADLIQGIDGNRFIFGDGPTGKSTLISDANSLTYPSGFYFGVNVNGMPNSDWYNILLIKGNGWPSPDGYAFQFAQCFWNNEVYVRRLMSGTWQPWYKLWSTFNFNPDTKVDKVAAITQASHGFAVGNCVRLSGSTWVKSQADSVNNAGTVGVVSEVVDTNNFRMITSGLISGSYTAGVDYFLSPSTAGAVIVESTWEIGQVRQYVGTGTGTGLMVDLDCGDEISSDILNDKYVTSMEFNTTSRILTLYRSAGLSALSVVIPTTASAYEDIAFEFRDITKGTAQTYIIDIKASFAYTIFSAVLESDGTLSGVSIRIAGNVITGLSSLSVASVSEINATGANSVVSGNQVTIVTTASYSGTPTLLRGKLKIQRA